MALNDTQTKSLRSLTLTDLILPQAALENIVENNELSIILSNGYVPLSSYNSLVQRVEAIEQAGVSSYASDKDQLCAACQQLCEIVSTLSVEVPTLNENIQALCTLVQTSIEQYVQHNSMVFSSINRNVATIAEETPSSTVQLIAAMPERNEFAIAEDQLPAEEPTKIKTEVQVEKPIEATVEKQTNTATRSRKKKNK